MARLSRTAKQAQTRRRLLEAARAVFAEQGVAPASVDAIAEAAGFSKSAIVHGHVALTVGGANLAPIGLIIDMLLPVLLEVPPPK